MSLVFEMCNPCGYFGSASEPEHCKKSFYLFDSQGVFGRSPYWTFGSLLVYCVMYTCIILFIQAVKILTLDEMFIAVKKKGDKTHSFWWTLLFILIKSGFILNLEYSCLYSFSWIIICYCTVLKIIYCVYSAY